jgi:hypothetical protein
VCPSNSPRTLFSETILTATSNALAHPGSIIKATNAPVPYNIVGILNDNGHAFIPQVPMNTKVTYSLYDPVTGFYDPDVGTYTTGPAPGGFDRPILLFQPNTQIRTYSLKLDEPVHDSVSLDFQRIDYLMQIGVADTSGLFNVGFSSQARLSLRIEDPDGSLLFDNTDISCYPNAHLRFGKVGTYRIRVAYGVSAQAGVFDLGISHSPYSPIPSNCLCGNVLVDTLFEELSPYNVRCSANILANDTLTIESGVALQFESGGSVTATGMLTGVGTSTKPIKLRPAGTEIRKRGVTKEVSAKRKEVQP